MNLPFYKATMHVNLHFYKAIMYTNLHFHNAITGLFLHFNRALIYFRATALRKTAQSAGFNTRLPGFRAKKSHHPFLPHFPAPLLVSFIVIFEFLFMRVPLQRSF